MMRWALIVLLLSTAGLCAQGMSEEYVRARAAEKYSKPHGFSFEADLYAYIPYFDQMQKVRANGVQADRVGYVKDMDGFPVGIFGGLDLRFRFSWHDSIEIGYNPYFVRAFSDGLDDFKRWNGTVFPPNTDIDYAADMHDFRILYRRDLARFGLSKNFTIFGKIGLEYTAISTQVGSDTLTLLDDNDKESFRELLPWYSLGFGAEMEIGQHIRVTAEVRGTYLAGMTTFQRRDDNNMKQGILSLTAIAGFEWNITDWFAVIGRVRYRYLKARLYGGFRQDNFLWWSVGPDIGFGFRF